MIVRAKLSALKQGHWYEYLVRFGLGGLATVFTTRERRNKISLPAIGMTDLNTPAVRKKKRPRSGQRLSRPTWVPA